MSGKRLTVRFDLGSECDCRVWERLQGMGGAKSRTIITALDAYFSQVDLAEVVRQTIRECLQGAEIRQLFQSEDAPDHTAENLALLDCMEAFMGL